MYCGSQLIQISIMLDFRFTYAEGSSDRNLKKPAEIGHTSLFPKCFHTMQVKSALEETNTDIV